MRKNRASNGYVGKNNFDDINSGSIAGQKIEQIKELSVRNTSIVPDYVRPSNGNGYGASATASLKDATLRNISRGLTGAGYSGTPIAFISGGGATETSYASVTLTSGAVTAYSPHYKVESVVITDPGSSYSSAPTVTFAASDLASAGFGVQGSISGVTLTVTTRFSGIIYPGMLFSGVGITGNSIITGYGTGTGSVGTYTVTPSQTVGSVAITGTARATGTAVIENARVSRVDVTYPGAAYTSIPTITFSGGGSPWSTATAYCTRTTGITYSSVPTVTVNFGGTGSGASAIAQVQGQLGDITITSGGSNYTLPPTVYINDGDGNETVGTGIISGGSVTGVTFTRTSTIFSSVPTVEIGGWTPLPSVSVGEHKIVGAYAVYNNESNFLAFSVTGCSYSVDWGDGTSNNYVSGATAQKVYGATAYTGFTAQDDFRGYKTAIISVSPIVAGNTFSQANFNIRHSALLAATSRTTNWLDILMSSPTLSTLSFSAGAPNIQHRLLEQFIYIGTNQLTSLAAAFAGCITLKNVNLSTDNVTDFSQLFGSCISLEKIPLFNTSKATTMFLTFNGCHSLKSVPLLNTSLVSDMGNMFANCYNLKTVPLFDTTRVTSMSQMFTGCNNLENVPLFNTRRVTTMASMFAGCRSLETVPTFNTSSVTDMSFMFDTCASLKIVPLFNTAKVTTMDTMFRNCYNLVEVPLFKTSSVTNVTNMFSTCLSLERVPLFDTILVNTFSSMFTGCSSLRIVPAFDTRSALLTNSMFNGCSSLKTVPLFDTSRVTSMSNMFNGCTSLKIVPQFNTGANTDFGSMFQSCNSLESVPPFDYTNATTFFSMFNGCSSLKSISTMDISLRIGTLAGTAYQNMFSSCASLKEIRGITFGGNTAYTTVFASAFTTTPNLSRVEATGIRNNVSFTNCLLGVTALNEIFTNLGTVGLSGSNAKTITITGNLGTAGCNRGIATTKGWAVTV